MLTRKSEDSETQKATREAARTVVLLTPDNLEEPLTEERASQASQPHSAGGLGHDEKANQSTHRTCAQLF